MENEKLPKPSPADVNSLREIEKKQKDGPWSDEHMELLNSFDWSPELVRDGEMCGLKDAFGNLLLPVQYEDVKLLSSTILDKGDRFVAMQNGKWGVALADMKGTWLISPEFDFIGYPNNITHVCKDGLWGVMDIEKGKYLIPAECEHIDDYNGFMFMNGIGAYEKGGLHGVITSDGFFTQAIFEDIDLEPHEWVKVKYKGEWGYIDADNQFTAVEDEAYYIMDID